MATAGVITMDFLHTKNSLAMILYGLKYVPGCLLAYHADLRNGTHLSSGNDSTSD